MWVKFGKINLNLEHVIEFHLDQKDNNSIVFETLKERLVYKFENNSIRNLVFNHINWNLCSDTQVVLDLDDYIHELTKEED